MSGTIASRDRLLARLDREWNAFTESFAGLSGRAMETPGGIGDWSVKDLIAHVTTWEEESLTHLPGIADGVRQPTYASAFGGLDAFNALMHERKASLPLSEVLKQINETHQRLVEYVRAVPPELLDARSRFRRRLRLDTYSHYPIHTAHIRAWRDRTGENGRGNATSPA
jgi:hypothetical protein